MANYLVRKALKTKWENFFGGFGKPIIVFGAFAVLLLGQRFRYRCCNAGYFVWHAIYRGAKLSQLCLDEL